MSVHPENRFTCNRCLDDVNVPVSNGPPHTRTDGPEGWLTVKIGSDPGTPLLHFCPPCAFGLQAYIQNDALVAATAAAKLAKEETS